MNNFITSQIRTYVPIVVGGLVAWLTTRGFNIDTDTQAGLVVVLTGLLQAVYYFLARLLETWNPKFGTLLGVQSQPKYKETR
jgi:hypothetical protein